MYNNMIKPHLLLFPVIINEYLKLRYFYSIFVINYNYEITKLNVYRMYIIKIPNLENFKFMHFVNNFYLGISFDTIIWTMIIISKNNAVLQVKQAT